MDENRSEWKIKEKTGLEKFYGELRKKARTRKIEGGNENKMTVP